MSSIILNVVLCASVVLIGIILTKRQKKYSKETGSYQLRAYIPTIWTSLGILGTFVSILYSLILFANDTNDTNNINSLIFNIAPAFSTSIIGIIGSIWTSLSNKRSLASVESEEDRKFKQLQEENNISRSDEAFSPEEILLNILKEIKDGRIKSAEENEKLIGEMATLFGKTNGAIVALQNNLGEKQNNLSSTIKQEYGNIREDISNALKQQKDDFKGAVAEMKTNFTDTLLNQNTILENKLLSLDTTLGQKIDLMISNAETIMNRLVTVTETSLASESEKRNEELHNFIEEEDKKIREFINEQLQQYKGINGNMNALVSDIRNLFEKDVKDTINQFAEHELKVSAETITLCNNKLITDASDYLNNHMSAISVYLANLDNQTKTTYESFKETVNGIAQTIASKLQELYDQQTSLIGGTIDNNRNQIESALSTNGKSIQTILNANKEAIESVSNEIKADNSSIKNELAAAQQRWKEASEKIEADHFGKVVEIHTHTEAEILDIQNRIISIGNKLQEKLDNIEKEVTRSISEFENKLNEVKKDSVGQSEKTIKELNAQIQKALQVEALQNASVKLSTNIGETLGRFDENTSNINQNLQAVAKSINDSSEKYAATIQEYDDKLGYIESTLNMMKQHITSVSVLEGVLKDVNEAVLRVEKMRDDVKRDTSMSSDSHKSSRAKKQES